MNCDLLGELMAKALFVCARHPRPELPQRLAPICNTLRPEPLTTPPRIWHRQGITCGIASPGPLTEEHGASLLMGTLFDHHQDWHQPGTAHPDGSFALFRGDDHAVEVLTDPGGSRTIWYFHNDDLFAASTSQLALIALLGSFEFDPATIAWLCSTSGLGPGLSWDRRLRALPPDSLLRLDRSSWTTTLSRTPATFAPSPRPATFHRQNLLAALLDALDSLSLDLSTCALSLSGGYDSRALLSLLHHLGRDLRGLTTVTWGTPEAPRRAHTDAAIARRVAAHYGLEHRYFPLRSAPDRLENTVDRFLTCGEGRVDHIAGYLDGFGLFETLHHQRLTALLRGDEAFGLKVQTTASPLTVRLSVRFGLFQDFENLGDPRRFGLPPQEIPFPLQQRPAESLSTYRDRLFHEYKLPFVVAALNDLKAPFIEPISPLLSRRILFALRALPDELRNRKLLFRQIIDALGPPIPIATASANPRTCEALRSSGLLELLLDELHSLDTTAVLPPALVRHVLADLDRIAGSGPGSFVARLYHGLRVLGARTTPRPLKNRLVGRSVTPRIDPALLAWRLFLVARMHRRLQAASLLHTFSGPTPPISMVSATS